MTELHLIGLKWGAEARALETRLIEYAQLTYPLLCSNVAPGGGGLRDNVQTFIYVARRVALLRD